MESRRLMAKIVIMPDTSDGDPILDDVRSILLDLAEGVEVRLPKDGIYSPYLREIADMIDPSSRKDLQVSGYYIPAT